MPVSRLKEISSSADVQAGFFLFVLSIFAFWLLRDLESGTLSDMGSALFPRAIACMLLALALVLIVRGVRSPLERTENVHVKPITAIIISLAIFSLATPIVGLFAGIIILGIGSSLASKNVRWVEVIVLSSILSAICCYLFVELLGLPINIMPLT